MCKSLLNLLHVFDLFIYIWLMIEVSFTLSPSLPLPLHLPLTHWHPLSSFLSFCTHKRAPLHTHILSISFHPVRMPRIRINVFLSSHVTDIIISTQPLLVWSLGRPALEQKQITPSIGRLHLEAHGVNVAGHFFSWVLKDLSTVHPRFILLQCWYSKAI